MFGHVGHDFEDLSYTDCNCIVEYSRKGINSLHLSIRLWVEASRKVELRRKYVEQLSPKISNEVGVLVTNDIPRQAQSLTTFLKNSLTASLAMQLSEACMKLGIRRKSIHESWQP